MSETRQDSNGRVDALARVLGRAVSREEAALVSELEAAGGQVALPEAERVPTDAERVREAADCEEAEWRGDARTNPFGYVLGRVWRSREVGLEVVARYRWAAIMRDGRCVGWQVTGTDEAVRPLGPRAVPVEAVARAIGTPEVLDEVAAEQVTAVPTAAAREAYERQWRSAEVMLDGAESLTGGAENG